MMSILHPNLEDKIRDMFECGGSRAAETWIEASNDLTEETRIQAKIYLGKLERNT